MIQASFIHPSQNELGIATLKVSYSDSYVDERILKQISDSLKRKNLIAAVSHLIPNLGGVEGLSDVAREFEKFAMFLRRHGDLEITAREPEYDRSGSGEYSCSFTFEFRRKPRLRELPPAAPSWARPDRADPWGGE